jgi:hypothetical protein
MTSPTPIDKEESVNAETDSIPRTTLSDLFFALRVIAKDSPTTLEFLRQHFCVDRKYRTRGDMLWSTAAYNAQELQRLGLLSIASIPKTKKSYEQLKDRPVSVSNAGLLLAKRLTEDRAGAYDELFGMMFEAHPYLRTFVRVIRQTDLFVPVVTSLKEHISPKYISASSLIEDVSRSSVDLDSFFVALRQRLSRVERAISGEEEGHIRARLQALLGEIAPAANSEEPTEFAKKFLSKVNDFVLPVLFKNEGLTFDFRTHQILWSFGQEWKLWQSNSDHPDYDGRVVFRTATIRLSAAQDRVDGLVFDSGLEKTRANFLAKLYDAYVKVQRRTKETYVLAWQLRAVFCLDNRCQESVFQRLMEFHYTGSEEFELTLEIQRQKGIHDRPLRLGNRNIGLVRVGKRRTAE